MKLPKFIRRWLGLADFDRPIPKVGEVWRVWARTDLKVLRVSHDRSRLRVLVCEAQQPYAWVLDNDKWFLLNPPPVRIAEAPQEAAK